MNKADKHIGDELLSTLLGLRVHNLRSLTRLWTFICGVSTIGSVHFMYNAMYFFGIVCAITSLCAISCRIQYADYRSKAIELQDLLFPNNSPVKINE